MMIHGYAMLALGLALFYVRATMTNLFFYAFGDAVALLLVAASLLVHRRHRLDLRCWPWLPPDNQTAQVFVPEHRCSCLQRCFDSLSWRNLIAICALALSASKFGLARSWDGSRREQAVMYVLAVIAFTFSVCLVGVARQDDRESLALVGGYSLFMGVQMLLTMRFLQQQTLKPSGLNPGPLKAVRLHAASISLLQLSRRLMER